MTTRVAVPRHPHASGRQPRPPARDRQLDHDRRVRRFRHGAGRQAHEVGVVARPERLALASEAVSPRSIWMAARRGRPARHWWGASSRPGFPAVIPNVDRRARLRPSRPPARLRLAGYCIHLAFGRTGPRSDYRMLCQAYDRLRPVAGCSWPCCSRRGADRASAPSSSQRRTRWAVASKDRALVILALWDRHEQRARRAGQSRRASSGWAGSWLLGLPG